MTNLISTFAFWDLAFAPAAAVALKLGLIASVLLSLVKNLALAPFRSARRERTRHLVELEKRALGLLMRGD